jgi:hypothetical protein
MTKYSQNSSGNEQTGTVNRAEQTSTTTEERLTVPTSWDADPLGFDGIPPMPLRFAGPVTCSIQNIPSIGPTSAGTNTGKMKSQHSG